jgi:hypothetical protein
MIAEKFKSEIFNNFHNSKDLNNISMKIADKNAIIIFIENMTERNLMLESIVKPLTKLENLKPPYKDILFEPFNVFDFWIQDNKECCDKFVKDFLDAFNSIADRRLIPRIK